MRRPRTSRIVLALAAVAVLAVVLILWVGKNYFAAIAREQVVRKLEERFASEVELGDFRLTIFPTIVFVADKLVFRHHGRRDVPPLITIQRIAVSLLPWQLLRNPVRVRLVELTGLEIQVPAGRDADRKRDHADEAEADSPHRGKTGEKYPFLVQRIQADGTLLKILPKKQGKEPLTFDIHELSLWSVGINQPMSFETKLNNAKPPGLIDSTGRFGPWEKEDPGLTPVSGTYTFQNADLSVFKGISGKLSSEGEYQGVLERIVVDGWTDAPDFAVKVAGHPVHLKTRFHSIVDGTDGDTLLQPVQGEFLSVSLDAKGGVVGTPGVKGKSVKLDVVVAKARVEDLLRLALKPETPPLKGDIEFTTKFLLPPGDMDIAQRLHLDGRFSIESVQFTSFSVQEKLAELSWRARGRPKEEKENYPRVASGMKGRFVLKGGVGTISTLSFRVPGASVLLDGTFDLITEELDFRGELRMQARLSQTTSGFTSVLLKVLDPFFKKKGAGSVLPIKITGTLNEPSFGLNF